jgi:prophage DNA circulation protein
VLREIADGLKQAGQDSIAMAFIDGMSEAPQSFAEAIAEMFPDMQMMTVSLFWIATMRSEIDAADWDALIEDLATIFASTTTDQVIDAVDGFTARWEGRYPAVTARLNEIAADAEGLLAAAEGLRNGGVEFADIVNVLSELFVDPASFSALGMDESILQTDYAGDRCGYSTCSAYASAACAENFAA